MPFSRVIAFDPSMISENAGDDIIMKYVNRILKKIWPDDFIVHVPTHDFMGHQGRYFCSQASTRIVCGTNILTSDMRKTKMWSVGLRDIPYVEGSVLLGVGWREYEKEPNLYTKWFWNRILSKNQFHSVRDRYTEKKLVSMGFDNVLYTGCPTMWDLTPSLCSTIPTQKARNVITTLTNYRTSKPENDSFMVETLLKHYDKVYLWMQALEDYRYYRQLGLEEKVSLVPPGLDNYEQVLDMDDLDYCGTRLHAGIEAIHRGKRAIIVGKDNRAIEIARDTGLSVLPESSIRDLPKLIESSLVTSITMPSESIKQWMGQFE